MPTAQNYRTEQTPLERLRMDDFNFTNANRGQQATDDDVEWKCQFDAWTSRLRARQVA